MPRTTKTPPRRYVSPAVAAELYDVDIRTIYRWITEGKITGYRIGTKLIKLDLDEFDRRLVTVINAVP